MIGVFVLKCVTFDPTQDGLFRAAYRWGGGKNALSLKSITHTYNNETWHSYALPKEDQKNV